MEDPSQILYFSGHKASIRALNDNPDALPSLQTAIERIKTVQDQMSSVTELHIQAASKIHSAGISLAL